MASHLRPPEAAMSTHTFDVHRHGLFPQPHPDWDEIALRRRRIVHAVAIIVLILATAVLLFVASDAAGRTAILDWSTMHGVHWSSNVPHQGY
jgi:hypothetical protein